MPEGLETFIAYLRMAAQTGEAMRRPVSLMDTLLITKPDAATRAKQRADEKLGEPRAITFRQFERIELRNLVHNEMVRLEAEARAAPTRRKGDALNDRARGWRYLFDKLVD